MRLLWIAAFVALAACGSSADLPRPVPPQGKSALLVEISNNQQLALAGSVFWDGTAQPASIQYTGKSQYRPRLTLRLASPNGFGLFADYEKGSASIPVNLPEGCDDGGGDLKSGCYGQLGLAQFDRDGNPDIVVAFGDGNMNLHVNVIRYHPPGSAGDVSRSENWELIGSFEGQSKALLSAADIQLPIGSNGSGNRFVFADGRFLDFNAPSTAQARQVPNTPAPPVTQRPATPTGHFRADGLYVYDRTGATAAGEQERTSRTVAAGAPLCSSFKGAITAAAVMRSGNSMAVDAVLSRQGCETSSQAIVLDPGASVNELQAGVVVINTPGGDRVYTTADSLSTSGQ
ncbi:MAG TPA: hypothetical protein VMT29_05965 [Steroidobacteraceae bacterium]|nr:hypothetical protein [Steroidobacteraceae bacterium]